MAQHLELGESSFGGCEIWFSQHRWHVSEYVVFFKGSRYLPFSERQTDPALTFRPVSKGYRSHLLRTFPLSTLNFYNISVSNKHDGGKKKVQSVTVTSWINTSSVGPYLLGRLQYEELRSCSKKKKVYKWNGTGQLACSLFDCAFKNVAYFILCYLLCPCRKVPRTCDPKITMKGKLFLPYILGLHD